jgi:peptide/nickel transport system permease protein
MEAFVNVRMREFWRRYKRNKQAVFGLLFICFAVFLAVFAPFISPYDPLQVEAGVPFSPPSMEHPFGTDDIGKDILSGVIHGARTSLFVGFLAGALSMIIGVVVGAISGYCGGKIDSLLMRISEVFLIIPGLFISLLIIAIFGRSLWNIILVIGMLSWPSCARLVRAEFLSLKEREFVEAARALGASDFRLTFSEILPNATPPIVVNASIQVSVAILLEAALSFLGLSDPNVISWGSLLNNAQRLLRLAWWTAVFPGIALTFTTFALNLVGDGLNDALNPRLKER